VAARNLRRALGHELSPAEQRRALRTCFTHMALYGVDILRAPRWTPELSDALVERFGFERLDEALAAGTGAIVVMCHTSSLDAAGFSQAVRGLPIVVVTRALGSRSANAFVSRIRTVTGLRTLPPRGSAGALRQAIADNQIVCLVVDQHVSPRQGMVCELFGQLASTTPFPARLALETGAPVFPALALRVDASAYHRVWIEPRLEMQTPHADFEANVRHNTERINRVVEGWIRRSPEQWLWMHRRWKVQDNPAGWDIPPQLRHLLQEK
jgi:KDO2-lipid IV(A) lauroyltransferase